MMNNWFDTARLGMFIHWGHSSQMGCELSWEHPLLEETPNQTASKPL
ncbi:alpha-L-fucosidase, partial [Nostoc sp. CALU 1950]